MENTPVLHPETSFPQLMRYSEKMGLSGMRESMAFAWFGFSLKIDISALKISFNLT